MRFGSRIKLWFVSRKRVSFWNSQVPVNCVVQLEDFCMESCSPIHSCSVPSSRSLLGYCWPSKLVRKERRRWNLKGRRTNGTFGSTSMTLIGGGAFTTGLGCGAASVCVSIESLRPGEVSPYFLKLPRMSEGMPRRLLGLFFTSSCLAAGPPNSRPASYTGLLGYSNVTCFFFLNFRTDMLSNL